MSAVQGNTVSGSFRCRKSALSMEQLEKRNQIWLLVDDDPVRHH
jgi:hypothetical protein